MELKAWVLAARKHGKKTQAALAFDLSVTKSNVSGWENGHHKPSHEQVLRIAQVTGYPLLTNDTKNLRPALVLPNRPSLSPRVLDRIADLDAAARMLLEAWITEKLDAIAPKRKRPKAA